MWYVEVNSSSARPGHDYPQLEANVNSPVSAPHAACALCARVCVCVCAFPCGGFRESCKATILAAAVEAEVGAVLGWIKPAVAAAV